MCNCSIISIRRQSQGRRIETERFSQSSTRQYLAKCWLFDFDGFHHLKFTGLHNKESYVINIMREPNMADETVRIDTGRLHFITDSAPSLIAYIDSQQCYRYNNRAYEEWFGYSAAEIYGKQVREVVGETAYRAIRGYIERVLSGEQVTYEAKLSYRDAGTRAVHTTLIPDFDETGKTRGFVAFINDVSERKRAEEALREGTGRISVVKEQLEEERDILETVNRLGQLLSAELDLQKLVQTLTDAATEIIGAKFGSFFYNVQDERGASYMLYTLSGVPHEHFANFPMPRATELFGPTFRGESVIRIDDVKQDVRYGRNSPYYGMPPGHLPVTSYLAVPVISRSGEVLGGLFFGHPEAGVFVERHERIVTGLAGQAAIAMDNARLYETARKARQEAELANRLKDEFLATVSHELRTPLNSMLGWARMLQTGNLDDVAAARALEIIERNARSQQQIIEDILDVSRIITGKLRLDVAPIEIVPAVEAAIDALRPTAEAKGVRLQTVLDSKPNLVLGDTNRLQQVVWNLVSNAIKFTPKGGRVQVVLERINSRIEITVSDTGQGIGLEFLPYVFDRFRQEDSSTARTYGGLGLGLAIVRHLVELHGGMVAAQSAGEGKGATFIVRLPVAVMRQEGDRSQRKPGQHPSPALIGGIVTEYGLELNGVRVLVVDDEADARDLLSAVLEQCGAEVRAAGSTREAFEVLEQWKPDVITSDIGMPGEDGYALIRQLRALPPERGGNIPAAALTAYARSEDRLKALAAGYHMHVAKPVEPSELAAVVASLAARAGK